MNESLIEKQKSGIGIYSAYICRCWSPAGQTLTQRPGLVAAPAGCAGLSGQAGSCWKTGSEGGWGEGWEASWGRARDGLGEVGVGCCQGWSPPTGAAPPSTWRPPGGSMSMVIRRSRISMWCRRIRWNRRMRKSFIRKSMFRT